MNTIDIEKMTTQEQLQTMEALWDALAHGTQEPASPTWHDEILRARQEKIASGQAVFVSLPELKTRGA